MAQITIKNLSFRYSLGRENCLEKINLEINEGEFVVLCGKSGCGKTTLLRQLKPAIVPKGEREGKIYLNGTELDKTDLRTQSEKSALSCRIQRVKLSLTRCGMSWRLGLKISA